MLLDTLGLRLGSLLSTILVALGTGVTAYSGTFAHSYGWMVFGRALYGFGSGYVVVAQQTILCSRILSKGNSAGVKKGKWLTLTMGIQVAVGRLSGFLAQGTVVNLKIYFGHYSAGLIAAFLVSCFSLLLNVLYIVFESLTPDPEVTPIASTMTTIDPAPTDDCLCSMDPHIPLVDPAHPLNHVCCVTPAQPCIPTSSCYTMDDSGHSSLLCHCDHDGHKDKDGNDYGTLTAIEDLIPTQSKKEKLLKKSKKSSSWKSTSSSKRRLSHEQVTIHNERHARRRTESVKGCASNITRGSCKEVNMTSPKKFHPKYIFELSHLYWLVFALHGLIYGCWTTFLHINADMIHTKYPDHSPESVAWEAAIAQLLPVFLSPVCGGLIDKFGHRSITMTVTGTAFLVSMLLLKFTSITPIIAMTVFSLSLTLGPISIISSVPYITALTSDTPAPSQITEDEERTPLLGSSQRNRHGTEIPEDEISQSASSTVSLVRPHLPKPTKHVAVGTALGLIKSGANAVAGLMDPFLGGLQDSTEGKTYDAVLNVYVGIGILIVLVALSVRFIDKKIYGGVLVKEDTEPKEHSWSDKKRRIDVLMKCCYVFIWLGVVVIDWSVWITGLFNGY
ncbi:hypothetical protein HK098_000951 [Nowakowskiella sp. JEL0407]|nr:hypothetical protein HK098_000951 [Nowakowskiella sp. JEL0407]